MFHIDFEQSALDVEDTAALAKQYDVERVLQKAIYGRILLVREHETDERFAIKVVSKQLAQNRRCIKGTRVFEDSHTEFEILRKVREQPHPNLLQLAPDDKQLETDQVQFVTMPFLAGGELFAKVKQDGSFTEEHARKVCRGIAQGLRHLHTNIGYCHNDVSLENVLLDDDGTPVICDYGLAQLIGSRWDAARHVSGKLPYQAPEIYFGNAHTASAKADVFSLGVALFVLLTGIPPFELPDPVHDKRYAYIQSGRLPKLLQLWGMEISAPAIALLTAMLVHDPHKRLDLNEVLAHPWVSDDEEDIDAVGLTMRAVPIAASGSIASASAKMRLQRRPRPPVQSFRSRRCILSIVWGDNVNTAPHILRVPIWDGVHYCGSDVNTRNWSSLSGYLSVLSNRRSIRRCQR